jgi:hypothetical protein
VDHTDADRLELLDRIKARLPELDLAQQSVEWTTLPDGGEVLLVDGDDLHAYGSLDPIVPGHVGCVVIEPDGTRRLARAVPDPLAE